MAEDVVVQPDRPGEGTGTTILSSGIIQWETGFGFDYTSDALFYTLPTTLFRFGLHDYAELRLEYSGVYVDNRLPAVPNRASYEPDPLKIGTKIKLWGGTDEPGVKWIPRVSVLANIGLPMTKQMAKERPVTGTIDLLFENVITEWFNINYDFGSYWNDWAPMPDFFASLALNFTPIDRLGLFVESFNLFVCDGSTRKSRQKTAYDIKIDFGLTYLLHPRVQLDVSGGFNCYHSNREDSSPANHFFVGLGVAWLLMK